jgi:hypothetical protein
MKQFSLTAFALLMMASASQAQSGDKSYSSFPTGEGDPEAITCRPPQPMPNSRLNGPEVCKKNAVWAQYRRDGMDVAADGIHDVPIRGKGGLDCRSVSMGAGGSTASAGNMGMHCN